MNIDGKLTFAVEFTANEFRVVGLALAGKVTEARDHAEAAALNVRLLERRAQILQKQLEIASAALKHAKYGSIGPIGDLKPYGPGFTEPERAAS